MLRAKVVGLEFIAVAEVDHKLLVSFLHQAFAPIAVAYLAAKDGLHRDLLPVISIQSPPKLLLFAFDAAFGAERHIVL